MAKKAKKKKQIESSDEAIIYFIPVADAITNVSQSTFSSIDKLLQKADQHKTDKDLLTLLRRESFSPSFTKAEAEFIREHIDNYLSKL